MKLTEMNYNEMIAMHCSMVCSLARYLCSQAGRSAAVTCFQNSPAIEDQSWLASFLKRKLIIKKCERMWSDLSCWYQAQLVSF